MTDIVERLRGDKVLSDATRHEAADEILLLRQRVQDYIGALELERKRTGILATPHGYKLVPTGKKI